jgi:K+-sensing histidine kinase KdpD
MVFVRQYRTQLAIAAAFLGPLALALLVVPFRATFASTAAALLFVAVIVAVAVTGDRLAGVLASLSSALWFDFFLTEPYQRLAISHRPDIETTVSILLVGVVVTELAARSRHHHESSSQEASYVSMMHDLTELAASSAPESVIVDRASESLVELLSLRSCHFVAGTLDTPLARIRSDGNMVHAGIPWPVQQLGIPGPEAEIEVQWQGQVLGHFVLTPTRGQPVELERRLVAASVVDIVGAALSDRKRAA